MYPNYAVVRPTARKVSPARPTTVHLKTPGRYSQSHDVHFRSMTSARIAWNLSIRDFELIVANKGGWQARVPTVIAAITVHPAGWQPRGGQ